MSRSVDAIALSLVSHTNAGKTTLARTLLGRDVGSVRDAPHVTEFADVFTMLATPAGEQLLLWDTPGFGDSLRLVKRLRASAHPIGWLVSQIWDRWRERPFWASQQAMKNVRDEADVMLYLVNAAESPEAAGYVAPEMELLGWIAKPVIVLLNQLGPPGAGAPDDAELARWRRHLAPHAHVSAVLPLDAFARCWVQEGTLLQAIEAVLPAGRRALMARLRAAWSAERLRVFEAAVQSIAASLARLAGATEEVTEPAGLGARLRRVGAAIGQAAGRGPSAQTPAALAQQALAERLAAEVRANTAELIALQGLEGSAEGEILARLATHFETRLRMDEGKAALWGGMVSGALVGLKADILSGGLTLGGGLLAGGLLGALGAAGLARCVNLVRGTGRSWVAWNAEALDQLLEAALLRYLAVAHFGRGRGEWVQGESPPHWREVVQQALAPHRATLAQIWQARDARAESDTAVGRGTGAGAAADLARATAAAAATATATAAATATATAAAAAARTAAPRAFGAGAAPNASVRGAPPLASTPSALPAVSTPGAPPASTPNVPPLASTPSVPPLVSTPSASPPVSAPSAAPLLASDPLAAALATVVRAALEAALRRLYPDAPPLRESAQSVASASQ